MVDIVACPECGKPRALGHRCPSCGDESAAPDQQPATTPDPTESWQQPTSPSGYSAAPPSTFTPAPETRRSSGGTASYGRLFGIIGIVAVVVVAIVVAVVLTRGGAEVVEGEALVAGAPSIASDLAAQSLLRNAMSTFDMAVVEFGGFDEISQTDLQTMEPGITWVKGSSGLSASPPSGANAKQNTVAWVGTGPMSYELGTWSTSGVEYGVRVDRTGGGVTYYKDGQAGTW